MKFLSIKLASTERERKREGKGKKKKKKKKKKKNLFIHRNPVREKAIAAF